MKTPPTINELSLLGCSKTHIQQCRILKMSGTIFPESESSIDLKGWDGKGRKWGGLLLPIFRGIVGTAVCALCRVIMYKRHMVFLLPIVRVKNFMSLLCLKPRPKVPSATRQLPCLVSTSVSDASTRLVSSALLNCLSYIIFSLFVNLIKAIEDDSITGYGFSW